MAKLYNEVINSNNCEWLKVQEVPKNDINSYYTFAMRYLKKEAVKQFVLLLQRF